MEKKRYRFGLAFVEHPLPRLFAIGGYNSDDKYLNQFKYVFKLKVIHYERDFIKLNDTVWTAEIKNCLDIVPCILFIDKNIVNNV